MLQQVSGIDGSVSRVNSIMEETGGEEAVVLNRLDIEGLVVERAPFFKIWEAKYFPAKKTLLSMTEIGVEECAGHFPSYPVVPLIRISERMAQTGLLLIGVSNKKEGKTPVAVSHNDGRALSNNLFHPPLSLVIKAEIMKCKFGVYIVDTCAYSASAEPVAELLGIKYVFIPSPPM